MLYFDTSFLVPLFVRERSTLAIVQFVEELPPGVVAISEWTRVEFSSLLARDVRTKVLTREAAARVDRDFESVARTAFTVIVPARDDFALAQQYLRRHETALRAGDALHLAIASNHQATTIYSLDKGMVTAGTLLGLAVRDQVN